MSPSILNWAWRRGIAPPLLNRELVLEAAERVPDGAGGHELHWVALGTLWAEVKAGTGRQRDGAVANMASVPYQITVRAAPPGSPARPEAGQRLRDGARLFRILAVAEAGMRAQYLTCFALEEEVR